MAVMEMVDTYALQACINAIILHRKRFSPNGKYFFTISIPVRGIVNVHNKKSAIAKFNINIFLGVLIAGFRITEIICNKNTEEEKIKMILYRFGLKMSVCIVNVKWDYGHVPAE